jgi:acetyl-CoA carboxylase biotin carboxyl carrier protein|tara:strand:+ start:2064 stop:2435 length:372 start_codon:yes stop_codon:yes gene_type:complete
MEIDKNIILKLISVLEDLKKSLTDKDYKIKTHNLENQAIVVEQEDPKKSVKSPIVGTAYLSPEPGAKKFVDVGKNIKTGETVIIVEAMKTMNHIPSSQDGIVKKICVEDGQPVEFGQNLIIFE